MEPDARWIAFVIPVYLGGVFLHSGADVNLSLALREHNFFSHGAGDMVASSEIPERHPTVKLADDRPALMVVTSGDFLNRV